MSRRDFARLLAGGAMLAAHPDRAAAQDHALPFSFTPSTITPGVSSSSMETI
jgi:hypothetical protein